MAARSDGLPRIPLDQLDFDGVELGRGSYGVVLSASLHRGGVNAEPVAVKRIYPKDASPALEQRVNMMEEVR